MGHHGLRRAASAAGAGVTDPWLPYVISKWPMLGNADDVVGINNGIVTGATLTTDRNGAADSAYLFSGGDKIDCGSDASLDFSSGHSLAMWIKPDVLTAAGGLMCKTTGAAHSWLLALHSDGSLRSWGNTSATWKYSVAGYITTGAFHLIGLSWTSTGNVSYFINGVYRGVSTGQGYTDTPAHNLRMGKWFDASTLYDLRGVIDTAWLRSGATITADHLALYNATKP